jgi:hypothetical protein
VNPARDITKKARFSWLIYGIPSGYLTVCHGIDGPFIDGLPIKHGDFPWRTVK